MDLKILIDDAALDDLSKNKTHANIAEHLYNLITSDKTTGLTIGLEGEWGSGKSTVIKILNEKLKKNEDAFVFYIDTWSHEGDPLRRVFLESFIAKIKERIKNNESVSKFTEHLDVIANKIKFKQKTTLVSKVPELDIIGKITTGLAFFVPIGSVIIDHTFSEITIQWGNKPHWIFLLGCFFVLSPLLFSIFNKIFIKGKFFKNNETDTTTEISNEDEKSSVDFTNFFGEIKSYLANKLKIKKLVCIIDNLDRINEKDALKIWSTLQTFVQGNNSNIDDCTDDILKVFVLVPYDEYGLRKLWDGNECKRNLADEGANKKEVVNIDTTCSNSFFNKSFQLRLYVPRLNISGWEDFAKKQMDIALVDYSSEEKSKILNILQCTRANLNDSPTFREIKIYINQVGFLYPLHKSNNVSLESICYYVVLKYLRFYDYKKILNELVDGKLPDKSVSLYCDKNEMTNELCAILFMVSQEDGRQLLLQNPIQEALNSNTEKLKKLYETHGEVFCTVLKFILANAQNLNVQNTICTIYKVFSPNENNIIDILIQYINQGAVKNDYFSKITDYSQEFWKIVIKLNLENDDFINQVNSVFSKNIYHQITELGNGNDFVPSLHDVIVSLENKCTIHIDYEQLTFAGLVKIYEVLNNDTKVIAEKIENLDKFGEDIAHEIRAQNAELETVYELINLQFEAGKSIEWTETIAAVKESLTKNLDKDSILIFIRILHVLQKHNYSQGEQKITKDMLSNGVFWNNISLIDSSHEKNMVWYLFFKYSDNPDSFSVQAVGNSQFALNMAKNALKTGDTELAEKLYEIAEYTNDYNFFWKLTDNPAHKLIGKVIQHAIKEQNKTFFEIDMPYSNFVNALKIVEEKDYPALTKAFIDYSKLEISLIDKEDFEFSKNPVPTLELLKISNNEKIFNTLVSKMKSCSETDWTSIIPSNTKVFDIVDFLIENDKDIALENNFYNVFKKYAIDNIQNVKLDSKTLSNLYLAMGKSWRKEFSSQLELKLLGIKFRVSEREYKEFCKTSLQIDGVVTEHKGEFSDLIRQYIESENIDVLKFIVALINNAEAKFKPDAHYSETLKSSVEKLTDDELKENLAIIFRID